MPSTQKKQAAATHKLLGSHKATADAARAEMDEAVAHFTRASLELENYRQKHQEVVDTYDALRRAEERAYAAAKECFVEHRQALGNAYAGFRVGERRGVDARLLVKLMPSAIDLVSFSLPVKDFDKHLADGTIPEDVAEQVAIFADVINGPK